MPGAEARCQRVHDPSAKFRASQEPTWMWNAKGSVALSCSSSLSPVPRSPLVGAVWAGGWLALAVSGGTRSIPFSAAADAAPRLPAILSTPAEAWDDAVRPGGPGGSGLPVLHSPDSRRGRRGRGVGRQAAEPLEGGQGTSSAARRRGTNSLCDGRWIAFGRLPPQAPGVQIIDFGVPSTQEARAGLGARALPSRARQLRREVVGVDP